MLSEVIWKTGANPGTQMPVIRENTVITVSKLAGKKRVIDFDIELHALVDSLKIGGSDDEKGYGGFCIRLKLPGDIQFISNDTLVEPQEKAVTAGSQMDFRGSFEGDALPPSNVTLITHPIGNDVQQSWILRRKGSMQNVVYPGRQPVTLTKKGLKMKYTIVIW